MEKEIITTPTLAPPYAPYSAGVKVKKVGTFIFIAGVVPNDVDGNIVFKGDIRKQMEQVLKNLEVTLKAAGVTFKGLAFDSLLAAYLLEPTASQYSITDIGGKYLGQCSNKALEDAYDHAALTVSLLPELCKKLQEALGLVYNIVRKEKEQIK